MIRLCAIAFILAGTAAQAAMTPRNGLAGPNAPRGTVPGQVWPLGSVAGSYAISNTGGESCYFSAAGSSFITGPNTYLQLNDLEWYPPGGFLYAFPTYTYYGPARLSFTSATAGTISFDNFNSMQGNNQTVSTVPPPPVSFQGYSATSPNSSTLVVSFTLTIGGCSLPFNGTYHHQ